MEDKKIQIQTLASKIDQNITLMQKQIENPQLMEYFTKIFMKTGESQYKYALLNFRKNFNSENSDDIIQDRQLLMEIENLYFPTKEQSMLFDQHQTTQKETCDLTEELKILLAM